MSPVCRPYRPHDREALVSLWSLCHLTRPWNDPYRDIDRKLAVDAGPRGHRNDRRSVVVPAPDGNCLTPIENSTGSARRPSQNWKSGLLERQNRSAGRRAKIRRSRVSGLHKAVFSSGAHNVRER